MLEREPSQERNLKNLNWPVIKCKKKQRKIGIVANTVILPRIDLEETTLSSKHDAGMTN